MAPWPMVGKGGLIRGNGPWLYTKLRARECPFWCRDLSNVALKTRRFRALATVQPKIAAFYAHVRQQSPPPLRKHDHVGGTIYLMFYTGPDAGLVNHTRDLYVGHTYTRVLERFHGHLTAAWRIRRGLPTPNACTVDRLMARTGWADWHILMLEQFTVPGATKAKDPTYVHAAELRESMWARRLGTYRPFGLNLRGRTTALSARLATTAATAQSLVGCMPIVLRRIRFFSSRIYPVRNSLHV